MDAKLESAQFILRPAVKEILKTTAIIAVFVAGSRASMPDGLAPFGVALAAAAFMAQLPVGAFIGCALGVASKFSIESAIALCLFFAGAFSFKQLTGKIYNRQVLLSAFAGQLIAALIMRFGSSYAIMTGLLGCLAAVLLAQVYLNAIKVMQTLRARKLLAEDEIIALCLFSGAVLLGLIEIQLANILPAGLLACAVTMLISYNSGAGDGAVCGLALGAMMAVGGEKEYIVILGIAGITAGSLRVIGKLGCAVGGMIAAAIVVFYTRTDYWPLLNCAIGASLFLILPGRISNEVGRFMNAAKRRSINRKEYLYRLREMTGEKLREFEEAFNQMGEVFVSPVSNTEPVWDIGCLRNICAACSAESRCWLDREKLREYIEQAVEGRVPSMLERCRRLPMVTGIAKSLIKCMHNQEHAINAQEQSIALVGKQLKGVALVVNSMAKRLNKDVTYDEVMEARIMKELDKVGVSAKDVLVQCSGGKRSVIVEGRHCSRKCGGTAQVAVSEICGKQMRLSGKECQNSCRATYEEAPSFLVDAGVFSIAAGAICGDTAIETGLSSERHLLALSDGMGTGDRAAKESATAIKLLERLYRAEIERESAMEAVNRLLLLRSDGEMFTTIDICCIDLVSGCAELCKLGSAPTFWINSSGISVLSSDSLPVGILEKTKPKVINAILREGDWIIMMSDGVYEALGENIKPAVAKFACGDPRNAAKCLCACAKETGFDDDMTVIAARIYVTKRI